MKKKLSLVFSVLLLMTATGLHAFARTITIAGLIVDSQTLQPIASADIFDESHQLLGSSNADGYFNISLNFDKPGGMYFKLKVQKDGYTAITQNEHWGNLSDRTVSVMYFGLKSRHSKAEAFTSLGGSGNLRADYESVLAGFEKVRTERGFEAQLAQAKQSNKKVFLKVGNAFYLANNFGWIKLNSADDLVQVDDRPAIPASKLNDVLTRSKIKWMSPIDGKAAKFAVRTK